MVEVLCQPFPDDTREQSLWPESGRIPHGIPRVPAGSSGASEFADEFRRLHLRPGDHGADRRDRDAHRRSTRAYTLLRAGLFGVVRTEREVWPVDPVGSDEVPGAPVRI